MAIFGTKLVAANGSWLAISNAVNNQRAIVLSAFEAAAPMFVTRLGVFARRQSGTTGIPYVWLGLYALDAAGNPNELVCYTDRLPVTVAAGGGDVSGTVYTPEGETAGMLASGQRFALVVKVEGNPVEFAALASTLHWFRTVATTGVPPTDPFTPTGTLTDLAITLYADAVENQQPTADQDAPLDGAVVATTTPTFTGSFIDPHSAAPTNDRMSAYMIEVRRASDNALMWGGVAATFVASDDERNAGQFARLYAGSTLVSGGTAYIWRAAVADAHGAWSNWTPYYVFTINALGEVDVETDGTPNSKIDTASNAIDFTARWFHPTARPTDRVQVRIVLDDGRTYPVVRSGVEVVKAVASSAAPGTLFTISAAESGLFTLIPGLQAGLYGYQVRGRANDAQWSPWSDIRLFSVNAPPTIPTGLTPPTGEWVTTYPLLSWNLGDPDDDDVEGVDVDSEIRIYQQSGTIYLLVGTYTTNNYDPATGRGFLQTTNVHFATPGVYAWLVRGRDLSAGALGLGQWSTFNYLTYAAGPVVTITNPANNEIEPTSVPVIAFSVSEAITRFEVKVSLRNAATPIRSSGEIPLVAPATSAVWQIPAGWLSNGGEYDVEVDVWNAGNVKGGSLRRPFSVSYTQPLSPLGYSATRGQALHDYPGFGSVVQLAWEPSQYPPGEFAGYVIRRRLATVPREQATILRTITTPGQVRWYDYWAPSNTLLVYGLSQLRRVGSEVLESPVTEATIELERSIPVLCSALDAAALRFPLMWLDRDYGGDKTRPKASYVTWGSEGKPTTVTTPARYAQRKVNFSITVRSDERGHIYQHVSALEALIDSGHPLAFLPERQDEMMYCEVETWRWQRGTEGTRIMRVTLAEIDFTPGSQGGS
jgi:hypothetical protein